MADLTGQGTFSEEASEMLQLMTKKRTILSSPGSKLSSLYYNVMNSTVDAVEITYNMGRYSNSLTTPTFGAQSQVILANSSFVSEVYLHLELPNLYAGQTLSRGWGYGCLANLSFLFGSSNVSQLNINGQSLWAKVAMQCETAEKRSEMFRLGGDQQLGPILIIDSDPNSATFGQPIRDVNAVLSADILIPMPFSSASSLFSKKAFDSNLLNNPITIQIQFNQANSIYGGPQTTNPFPPGFGAALMYFRQGDLYSKGLSLKRYLDTHPDESMLYPWIYTQSYLPSQFYGNNTFGSPVTLNLLGIINADLLALTVGIVRVSQLVPPAGQPANQFQYDNIQNVALLYNGTIMFNAPRSSWKLSTLKSQGGQYFQNSLIYPTVPGPPPGNVFTSAPQDSYLLHIDFSAIRSMTFEGMMQNVWRIGNNTLSLQFNTEGNGSVLYQAYVSYHYNSVVQVQQGQTAIYFD
jgi:hypothetical protein